MGTLRKAPEKLVITRFKKKAKKKAVRKRVAKVVSEEPVITSSAIIIPKPIPDSVVINGVPFERNPLIGMPWEKKEGIPYPAYYKWDYAQAAQKVASGEWDWRSAYRQLILDDLFFLTYFVIKPFLPGQQQVFNHPFLVNACQEVEQGPKDYTLDIWAREHFKSSIITVGETIQDVLKDPDEAVGLFSYIRPIAKKFLFTIKEIFQRETILYDCFADRVWENPEKESPLWSLDEGIILRRTGNRKEATVSAWGLTEGMPTSQHFGIRKYDDITTEDMANSPSLMEQVKVKFDSSQNLGTENGSHRVIGTIYHHNDPLVYVRSLKDINTGHPKYMERFKPATETGLSNGVPVLISQKRLDDLKSTKTFNCQQLLDPVPQGDQKLNFSYLNEIDPQFLPKYLHKFLIVDYAGDNAANKTNDGDAWAVMLLGIEPGADESGLWNRYILDAYVDKMSESEAVDIISRMYLRGGIVQKFAYERFGNVTPAVASHVIELLAKRGRRVNEDNESFMWLKSAGRNKQYFIVNSLQWPLNNSKWFVSRAVPRAYIDRIKMEMDKFPFWHDDALNAMAYLDDIVKDETYKFRNARNVTPQRAMPSPFTIGSHVTSIRNRAYMTR